VTRSCKRWQPAARPALERPQQHLADAASAPIGTHPKPDIDRAAPRRMHTAGAGDQARQIRSDMRDEHCLGGTGSDRLEVIAHDCDPIHRIDRIDEKEIGLGRERVHQRNERWNLGRRRNVDA
jgi:hypothetical protein